MPKPKSVVVTFRVDPHLAEALERLPDKSDFIRQALRRTFHETCPACGGEGRVDCDAAKWLVKLLKKSGAKRCECCSTAYPPELASVATSTAATTCLHCGPDGHRH